MWRSWLSTFCIHINKYTTFTIVIFNLVIIIQYFTWVLGTCILLYIFNQFVNIYQFRLCILTFTDNCQHSLYTAHSCTFTFNFFLFKSNNSLSFEMYRLEWEMSVNNGEKNFMSLEEERLSRLKEYAHHVCQSYQKFSPKMSQVRRISQSNVVTWK